MSGVFEQDGDFHAWEFQLLLRIDGGGDFFEGYEGIEDADPASWELSEDPSTNSVLVEQLKVEVRGVLARWISHFDSLGLIRTDKLPLALNNDDTTSDFAGPRFCLVHQTNDAGLLPEALAGFTAGVIELVTVPGAKLTIWADALPTNATALFDAAGRGALGVGQWGGEATPDKVPALDELRGGWLDRVCLPRASLARLVERWAASGRDIAIYSQFGDFSERADGDCEVEWLVPKVIPRVGLTFVVADSGVGKSSLVHEWVAALSGTEKVRPTKVLGVEVRGRHICALISAEDSPGRISQRAKMHAKIWDRCTYYTARDPLLALEQHLQVLRQFPDLDFVVLDPVRSYLDGNEDSSDVAERFCSILSEFSREMNCAVILPHHIRKGGAPRTLSDVHDRMRGSTAFKASARMVIGMLRRRDGTHLIGPIKHNFDEADVWLPLMQGGIHRLDPETSTLVPINGHSVTEFSPNAESDPSDVERKVLAAVSRNALAGTIVRRSGRSGLYEARTHELASFSRATILDAIAALLATGRLTDGPAGLQPVPPSAPDSDGSLRNV